MKQPVARLLLSSLLVGCSVESAAVDPQPAVDVDLPSPSAKAPFDSIGAQSNVFTLDGAGRLAVQTNLDAEFVVWPATQNVTLVNAPAAVSWGKNRIDVFAVTTAGMLQHYATADGGATSYADNWGSMPGYPFDSTTTCDATSWGPGRLDVFCLGWAGDRQYIVHRWYDATRGGGWEALPSLPFGLTYRANGVAAATWGPGRLDVWIVDQASSPHKLRHAGTSSASGTNGWGWDTWSQGTFTSAPDATAVAGQQYEIVARCVDGGTKLCHWTYRSSDGLQVEKVNLLFDWSTARKPSVVGFGWVASRVAIVDQCYLTILDYPSYAITARRWIGCGLQNTADITSW